MSQIDTKQLIEAASEFALHPGFQNDAATKEFLDRFPLPVLLNALQNEAHVPGLESALVACLERIFRTQRGASLIPQYMPFIQVGLQAESTCVRCLACKAALVFPGDSMNSTDLRSLATRCSSLLAETQHGTEFLSKTNVLKLLCSLISDTSAETILRSRAMLISGRLLSNDNVSMFVDTPDNDEYESALEALGQTGSSMKGAELLLSNAQSASRHVISAAFDRQSHGRQLAALHALGNLAGVTRSENQILLNGSAEESLRRLIYEIASTSPKLTPSGLFLSVLQQDSEVRIAAYKMLTAMVARPWCLMVICTKQEIINLVTDPHTETIKLGMDAKYGCCKAIHKALQSTPSLDPALTGAAAKVEEAVERGPYLPRRHRPEAQPLVMTAERF
ncbi:unnamed protein product [Rhodiola kirilowii]